MSFNAYFEVEGNEFLIPAIAVRYEFNRKTDEMGKPASKILGGIVEIAIDMCNDSLIGWMFDPYSRKDVTISFYKMDDDSVEVSLKLDKAYLLGYQHKFSSFDNEKQVPNNVVLTISSGKITWGGTSIDKNWA